MKRLIRLPEVCNTTGISRAEIYRLERKGNFPKRVPIGARMTAWSAEEIQAWVEARIATRDEAVKQRAPEGQRLAQARA